MKKLKILLIAVAVIFFTSIPASAQFKWGIQAGMVTSDLKFSGENFSSSNRIGFTGGVTAQYNFLFGLGVQGSLMYVHKSGNVKDSFSYKADYLTLPIHLKYNFSLPAINKLLRPYVFTGPSFSYMISKKITNIKKGDIAWDLGIGADIINRIQLNIGYGFGCMNLVHALGQAQGYNLKIRQNSWTITLGYLF